MAVFQQELTAIIGADTSGFNGAMTKMQGTMKNMRSSFNKWAKYGIAAAAGIGAASVKMAVTFDKAMAEIETIANQGKEGMAFFREEIIKLSKESGVGATQLAEGLYQTISGGAKILKSNEDALTLMRAATTLSIAGMAEQSDAVDGILNVMNAYGKSIGEVTKVSDIMFTAVKLGKMRVGEFAASMKDISAVAAESGVSFEEMSAAMVTLTRVGMPANQSARVLRMVLMSILKPGEEATAMTEELGFAWNKVTLQEKGKGLAWMLGEASKKLSESGKGFEALVPNVRGLVGSLVLGKNGATEFTTVLDAMTDSAGSAADAMAILEGRTYRKWQKTVNEFKLAMLDLGDDLMPVFENLIKLLKSDIIPALKGVTAFIEKAMEAKKVLKVTAPEAYGKVVKAGRTEAEAKYAAISVKAAVTGREKDVKAAETLGAKLKIARDIMVEMQAMERLGMDVTQAARFAESGARLAELELNLTRKFPERRPLIERLQTPGEMALPREIGAGAWWKPGELQSDVSAMMRSLSEEREEEQERLSELNTAMTETVGIFGRLAAAADKIVSVTGFHHGGRVGGVGFGDSVPALLAPGEFVVRKQASALWSPFLQAINRSPGEMAKAVGALSSMPAGRQMVSSGASNTFIFNQPVDRHTIRGLIIPEVERSQRLRRIGGRSTSVPRRW